MKERMKAQLLPNLVGSVVFFLVIHFAFGQGELVKDLIETVIFFGLMTVSSLVFNKKSKKD
ncbi:hypothetical protein NFX39_03175 [Fructobacillus sp. W13]|uniref:Uncharacterized protein n=1 Tax=Fructobacillus apis TaxID=2935017 RepID=A0ABT0ZQ22_9LACO|nr:hypothetical protein [Fructobacillus apis]MCO0832092.1 hypothetical protein [Fructobacillus apis]